MPSLKLHQQCRWHICATSVELERSATQAILDSAQQAIAERGVFRIVLAGGATPRKIYQALNEASADWSAWQVYFGDERCLPPDHAERNSRMAALAWLDHVAIPRGRIHPIHAEAGAESAAADYAQTLEGIGLFDLVLLGLGEDGHTASLFPGHDIGASPESPAAIAVHHAPKPPPDRVSLSAQRLSAARQVMFLVTGETKRQAVHNWRKGADIPAAAIVPANKVDVYLQAALQESY
ncbi:MAG: 6-phosphogluconolactonase [Gallionella sp.]